MATYAVLVALVAALPTPGNETVYAVAVLVAEKVTTYNETYAREDGTTTYKSIARVAVIVTVEESER